MSDKIERPQGQSDPSPELNELEAIIEQALAETAPSGQKEGVQIMRFARDFDPEDLRAPLEIVRSLVDHLLARGTEFVPPILLVPSLRHPDHNPTLLIMLLPLDPSLNDRDARQNLFRRLGAHLCRTGHVPVLMAMVAEGWAISRSPLPGETPTSAPDRREVIDISVRGVLGGFLGCTMLIARDEDNIIVPSEWSDPSSSGDSPLLFEVFEGFRDEMLTNGPGPTEDLPFEL